MKEKNLENSHSIFKDRIILKYILKPFEKYVHIYNRFHNSQTVVPVNLLQSESAESNQCFLVYFYYITRQLIRRQE